MHCNLYNLSLCHWKLPRQKLHVWAGPIALQLSISVVLYTRHALNQRSNNFYLLSIDYLYNVPKLKVPGQKFMIFCRTGRYGHFSNQNFPRKENADLHLFYTVSSSESIRTFRKCAICKWTVNNFQFIYHVYSTQYYIIQLSKMDFDTTLYNMFCCGTHWVLFFFGKQKHHYQCICWFLKLDFQIKHAISIWVYQ